MEKYGHVLVKAFTERVDGPGLEAVMVNYKALHDQVIFLVTTAVSCLNESRRLFFFNLARLLQ